MGRYQEFDRGAIELRPLEERGHDLQAPHVRPLEGPTDAAWKGPLAKVAGRIRAARRLDRPVVLMMGAHPIKLGLSRYLIDLIERGFITHVAMNGAGIIHDFELAAFGGTSEDVARWISAGQFGLWRETGRLNDVIVQAARRREGLGEAVGRFIEDEELPYRQLSLAAAGWLLRVPVTCHVTIGADILHAHANADGAALGATSYRDFLVLAHAIENLEHGVFLNIGSAVTGPEVFLKALAMARNVARQRGRELRHFTTAVFDLVPLPPDAGQRIPPKDDPLYYYRPWKTLLVRTVSEGGQSFYIQGDHRQTIPGLWQLLVGAA